MNTKTEHHAPGKWQLEPGAVLAERVQVWRHDGLAGYISREEAQEEVAAGLAVAISEKAIWSIGKTQGGGWAKDLLAGNNARRGDLQ